MAVPPTSPKALLRSELKTRRKAFVSNKKRSELLAHYEVLASRVDRRIAAGLTVSAYIAIGDEIDPARLMARLHQRGISLALPHVSASRGSLRFLVWAPGDLLVPGAMGVQQPLTTAPEVEPDVILTPLLGFDRTGNRMGYGAGHYDTVFARFPSAKRIGLAWSAQHCDTIPTDPWDVPLDAIATENEWIAP
jgi:5-formyltetrahydrofolate cyclo-ligase